MPLSDIKIANMALSLLGAGDKIESFTEASPEAEEADIWYDYSRRIALEFYDWSFARKRQTLALHGDDPSDDWSYRYQYPVDCIRLRRIFNPWGDDNDAVQFRVEISDDGTKSILTNMEDAIGIYTFEQDDPAMYSSFFAKFLAHILAVEMCITLTGKMTLKDRLEARLAGLSVAAAADDANETQMGKPRDSEWIRFRGAVGTIGISNDWEAYPDAAN